MAANSQASQDTLFALAKDTGGTAMFDNNDLALGITRAARAVTDYYIVGLLQHSHGEPTESSGACASRCRQQQGGTADVPAGLLRRQDVRELHHRRQGAPARGGVHARGSDHRDHDRDGAELLRS